MTVLQPRSMTRERDLEEIIAFIYKNVQIRKHDNAGKSIFGRLWVYCFRQNSVVTFVRVFTKNTECT